MALLRDRISREVLPVASLLTSEVQRSLSSQRSRLQTPHRVPHCTRIKHTLQRSAQRQPARTSVVRDARTQYVIRWLLDRQPAKEMELEVLRAMQLARREVVPSRA